MTKRINVNFKQAYNALLHKNRKDIEESIDDKLSDLPANSGLFLTDDSERLPIYGPLGACEKVISRKSTLGQHSGARIVLTKDNFGSRATGLGGAGGSKCEAIDIVAGQLSAESFIYDSATKSRANFATDGARIYLTERGNINHYFATENRDPVTSISDNLKSGIGIKADHTLVIGRERVRILAGLGSFQGGERLVCGNQDVTQRIEIGSITEDLYQPAVLGSNLSVYLSQVSEQISNLNQKVQRLEEQLAQYKVALGGHTHIITAAGIPTTPSLIAGLEAPRGVIELLNQTTDNILSEYDKEIARISALGIPESGIKGSPSDFILSNTVFIGR